MLIQLFRWRPLIHKLPGLLSVLLHDGLCLLIWLLPRRLTLPNAMSKVTACPSSSPLGVIQAIRLLVRNHGAQAISLGGWYRM